MPFFIYFSSINLIKAALSPPAMVKVLEKRIEESYTDRLWRIVLGTTVEIVGGEPIVRKYFDLDGDTKKELSPETLQKARIVAIEDMYLIGIDYSKQKDSQKGITVHSIPHWIYVFDPGHYNLAHRLAQAYEQRLQEGTGPGREFTLQKEYQE